MLTGACGGDDEPPAVTVTERSTTVPGASATSTTLQGAPSSVGPTTTLTPGEPTTTIDFGEPALNEASTVSTVGFDTVTFGMTVRTAESAARSALVPQGPIGDCYVVVPAAGPEGVSFVVTAGTIERVDIDAGSNTTRSGLGIGTPHQRVIDAFPERISVQTTLSGATLIFTPSDEADQAFRVIFETDGTTVTSFRAGRVPMVEPKQPCS